jgi:ribosomal protein L37E
MKCVRVIDRKNKVVCQGILKVTIKNGVKTYYCSSCGYERTNNLNFFNFLRVKF